jgi:hypothetical protein
VLEQTIQVYLFLLQPTSLGRWIQPSEDGNTHIEHLSFEKYLLYSFEKRIYIPLPGVNERKAMFKIHLGTETSHTVKENEWMQLAQKAEQ